MVASPRSVKRKGPGELTPGPSLDLVLDAAAWGSPDTEVDTLRYAVIMVFPLYGLWPLCLGQLEAGLQVGQEKAPDREPRRVGR